MRKRIIAIIILGAVAAVAVSRYRWPEPPMAGFDPKNNRLSKEVKRILDEGDRFTVLSLDPMVRASDKETFHGFHVLGKTEIRTRKERRELLRALYKGIAGAKGWALGCFNPRHGIRSTLGGETVDLVICFECSGIRVYGKDSKESGGVLTSGSAAPTFNRTLERAGLPIAKPAH
jgi:hypothetical protein